MCPRAGLPTPIRRHPPVLAFLAWLDAKEECMSVMIRKEWPTLVSMVVVILLMIMV